MSGGQDVYRIPFSFYDFASYLTTGFIFLFSLDFLLEIEWVTSAYLGAADGVFIFILTFILGHLISQFSAELANRVEGRYLGQPSKLLFESKAGFFQAYYRPLPSEIRTQVLRKYYERTGSSEIGEGMFLHCFHLVKLRSAVTYERLQIFIGTYGLARNLSFTFGLVSLVALLKMLITAEPLLGLIAISALTFAYLLFLRYLKFYRLFAVEIYISYLFLAD